MVLDVGFGLTLGSSESIYIVEWGSDEKKFCLVNLLSPHFQIIHWSVEFCENKTKRALLRNMDSNGALFQISDKLKVMLCALSILDSEFKRELQSRSLY